MRKNSLTTAPAKALSDVARKIGSTLGTVVATVTDSGTAASRQRVARPRRRAARRHKAAKARRR
jgi:hypothetical protein